MSEIVFALPLLCLCFALPWIGCMCLVCEWEGGKMARECDWVRWLWVCSLWRDGERQLNICFNVLFLRYQGGGTFGKILECEVCALDEEVRLG